MEFRVRRKIALNDGATLPSGRTLDLQLYRNPPSFLVSLREFEEACMERLRVLRIVAATSMLKGFRPFSTEWSTSIFEQLKNEGLRDYLRSCRNPYRLQAEGDERAKRKDVVAHFALRLAYCRTDDLRKWFVARENELFRLRFSSLGSDGVKAFLSEENLRYEPITDEEKRNFATQLRECISGYNVTKVDIADYYKVDFVDALDLVRNRKVYLNSGNVYVPSDELVIVIASRYRIHINASLASAVRKLPQLEVDERLVTLLKSLHNSYSGTDYVSSESVLPIENLDALSEKSYPLCMRRLHETLKSVHHLKHNGRLQYGLFLKAAGVTYEDSMRFWKEEFTKKIEIDKFEKNYSYGVKYNYGLAGSRKNYSAYSCMKIIQTSVGPNESHGCPFHHYNPTVLKTQLLNYGISLLDVEEIIDLTKKGHYQIACSKYFDIIHNIKYMLAVNHPNQYLETSQNILSGKIKHQDVHVPTENQYTFKDAQTDENWNDDFDVAMMDI